MLKKIFFIMIICFSIILLDTTNEEILLVSDEVEEFGYYIYEVKIDNLTTRNFLNYFDDKIKVIKIYPFINPIYNYDLDVLREFTFFNKSNTYNINYFKNIYLNSVDKYYNEKEKYIISGIPIDRVIIYTTNYMIEDLITKGNVRVEVLN